MRVLYRVNHHHHHHRHEALDLHDPLLLPLPGAHHGCDPAVTVLGIQRAVQKTETPRGDGLVALEILKFQLPNCKQ